MKFVINSASGRYYCDDIIQGKIPCKNAIFTAIKYCDSIDDIRYMFVVEINNEQEFLDLQQELDEYYNNAYINRLRMDKRFSEKTINDAIVGRQNYHTSFILNKVTYHIKETNEPINYELQIYDDYIE